MRCEELRRRQTGSASSEPRGHVSVTSKDADTRSLVSVQLIERAKGGQLTDIEIALPAWLDAHGTWALQTGPLRLEMSAIIEDLHAVVFAIRNIDPTVRITADIVWKVEVTRFKSAVTPGAQMPPASGIQVNVCVAVAVADINISIRCQRRVRAAIEWNTAHGAGRPPRDADFQKSETRQRELAYRMVSIIGAVDAPIVADMNAVRPGEYPLAPGANDRSVPVEHDHWVVAAIEEIDIVVAVDGDSGHIAYLQPVRQSTPVVLDDV